MKKIWIIFLAVFAAEFFLNPAAPAAAGQKRLSKIVVDAGHGGHDFGAAARGLKEKELALDVALRLKRRLEDNGLEVFLTRIDDTFIPLSERPRLANRKGADLFVSVHVNASPAPALRGFEVYYLSEAVDDQALALERAENASLGRDEGKLYAPSRNLKAIVWDLKESENRRESVLLSDLVARKAGELLISPLRRVRSAGFYVLKWSQCPAVLVETGYLTNREDERSLKSALYRKRLAEAVTEGILAFKKIYDSTNGFTTQMEKA